MQNAGLENETWGTSTLDDTASFYCGDDNYPDEINNEVQARIDAQLEILEARPQVLNKNLEVAIYEGGEAGFGYEVDNILEFSRTPMHRSGPDALNSTLILKCTEPLLLDYVRISTSTHVNFAVRSGVIWLYAAEHGDAEKDKSVHSELFRGVASESDFDRVCDQVAALRREERRTARQTQFANATNNLPTVPAQKTDKPSEPDPGAVVSAATVSVSVAGEDTTLLANTGSELKAYKTDVSADAKPNTPSPNTFTNEIGRSPVGADDGDGEEPGMYPDCFYFETDPVTFTATVALRNQSRIPDLEKYIRGVFAEIDINGDGELSMDELVPPLIKMGYSARFARKIIRDADDDGNGVIDADEFTAHMSTLNISDSNALCNTVAIKVLFTTVHDTEKAAKEMAARVAGEKVEEKDRSSFVQDLLDAGYGEQQDEGPDENDNRDDEANNPTPAEANAICQKKKKKKRRKRKPKPNSIPFMHCSYMCFCGHTVGTKPREPDPNPLFDYEFVLPRHLRRPFVNVAPPIMAPMPAPGPIVLPTLNVFDADFMQHLNKSPCVIVYVLMQACCPVWCEL